MRKRRHEDAYKVYMSEAIKNINRILAENMTGRYMTMSYADVIEPKPKPKETAEQIIDRIRNGLKRLH